MRASRLVTSAASTRKAFARVTADDIAFFRSLDPKMVVTDREEVAPFTVDWMRKYRSTDPSLVLRPRDTQTVSRVLAHCNARRLAVVPQGGNTGLVGGSVPVHDEIVLSLQRMNRMVRALACWHGHLTGAFSGVHRRRIQRGLVRGGRCS